MADTTKLASTFVATVLTLHVRSRKLAAAVQLCREMGLRPKVCGFYESLRYPEFRVQVPADREQDFMAAMREAFSIGVSHATKTELTCPLAAA